MARAEIVVTQYLFRCDGCGEVTKPQAAQAAPWGWLSQGEGGHLCTTCRFSITPQEKKDA